MKVISNMVCEIHESDFSNGVVKYMKVNQHWFVKYMKVISAMVL
jgi:hypothetical protein